MRGSYFSIPFCVALMSGLYLLAGQQTEHKRKYVNRACGFSIMLADRQRIRLARNPAKRPPCTFSIVRGSEGESVWLSVHHGAFEEAAKDMGSFAMEMNGELKEKGRSPPRRLKLQAGQGWWVP